MKKLLLILTVLVILVFSIICIAKNWDFVSEFAGFVFVAIICATICFLAIKGMEEKINPFIGGLIIFLTISLYGWNATSFDCQMEKLEKEFEHAATYSDAQIVWYGNKNDLNYHGKLTEILARRDDLLKRYHRQMDGSWWVSTDGVDIRAHYHWKPF